MDDIYKPVVIRDEATLRHLLERVPELEIVQLRTETYKNTVFIYTEFLYRGHLQGLRIPNVVPLSYDRLEDMIWNRWRKHNPPGAGEEGE